MKYITTKEQARKYAIDYQQLSSKHYLSYDEIVVYQNVLLTLGEKFNLTEEFIENGII